MALTFGDLELDLSAFELRRQGVRVPMEPQAFDVLVYLIKQRDRVVSKEELMDQVWGGRFVSATAVTSRIKQVRRAVGDDGQSQAVIRTLHGRGYRFVATAVNREAAAPSAAGEIRIGDAEQPARAGIVRRVSGPARSRAPRSTPPGSTMVGRAEESAMLRTALDRAVHGGGHTILIGGEPGIGKSELLASLTAFAKSSGATVLTGRAIASGGPYRSLTEALMSSWRAGLVEDSERLRPFRHALGRILPGWSDTAPAERGVDPVIMVGEGLLRVLLGFEAPVCVLALEDVHDADADTLAVLDYLAASIDNLPVLIVATYRDFPRPRGLEHLLAAPHTAWMSLERMPDADVYQLVDSLRSLPAATRDQLVLHAEGLPVVVADLVDGAGQHEAWSDNWTVPDTFTALIDARMAALTEQERQLLGAAAVLGATPDWDLVPRIAEVEPADAVAGLRHAVEVHLLVADQQGLRWRHGLIRRAVWAVLMPPQRRTLILRAAETLLAEGSESASDAAAELLLSAGQQGRAAEVLVSLAQQAVARGALRTAGELLARAEATGQKLAAVAIVRVELMTVEGRAADALSVGAASVDEARGDEHAELCLQLAQAAVEAAHWAAAADWVVRAGRPEESRSLVLLADSAHGAGRVAEAREFAEFAVTRAREGQSPNLLAEALCVSARIRRLDRLDRAREQFAEAAQIASEFGLKPLRVTALFGLGTLALLDDDASLVLQARDAALDIGLLGQAAMADVLLGEHQLVSEGPANLDVTAARLDEYGRVLRIPMLGHFSAILSATRAALAGDVTAMERHLSVLRADREPADNRAQVFGVRALASLAEHDIEAAAELLDAIIEPLLDHGSAAPIVHFGLWAVVSARVGRHDQALRTRLEAHPAMLRRANQGAMHYADAILAGRAGEPGRAEAAFAAGEQLLAPIPWWHLFLRMIAAEAAVTDGWGEPVPLLRADVAACEQGGDLALARIGRDLLRRAGAPTRRGRGQSEAPPALRAAGLTSRELDVLRLVEGGLSNRAISERLFLSPRTVETHVGNLLAKSGVANRQELRVWSRSLTP